MGKMYAKPNKNLEIQAKLKFQGRCRWSKVLNKSGFWGPWQAGSEGEVGRSDSRSAHAWWAAFQNLQLQNARYSTETVRTAHYNNVQIVLFHSLTNTGSSLCEDRTCICSNHGKLANQNLCRSEIRKTIPAPCPLQSAVETFKAIST
jgi:hypothetical protein